MLCSPPARCPRVFYGVPSGTISQHHTAPGGQAARPTPPVAPPAHTAPSAVVRRGGVRVSEPPKRNESLSPLPDAVCRHSSAHSDADASRRTSTYGSCASNAEHPFHRAPQHMYNEPCWQRLVVGGLLKFVLLWCSCFKRHLFISPSVSAPSGGLESTSSFAFPYFFNRCALLCQDQMKSPPQKLKLMKFKMSVQHDIQKNCFMMH